MFRPTVSRRKRTCSVFFPTTRRSPTPSSRRCPPSAAPPTSRSRRTERRVSFQVKDNWVLAGIFTVSDVRIRERLVELSGAYNKQFRNRNIMTLKLVETRKAYLAQIKKTFDVKDPNARQAILDDRNRSENAKTEDLGFFNDFLGNCCIYCTRRNRALPTSLFF
jgi:hypothetical protein